MGPHAKAKRNSLVVATAFALSFLTSAVAGAQPDAGASSPIQLPGKEVTRVITAESLGGRAEVRIRGQEEPQPDGTCAPVEEIVTLKADPNTPGLALDTEIADDCRITITYFGPPVLEDEMTPTGMADDSISRTPRRSVGPAPEVDVATTWSGNYLHSRHRLHDAVEIIIADFWLHNHRRWNGSGVFVCSPGWSCFVGGQSRTYKSWNHPGTIQLWYNTGCTEFSNCYSVTADGTGNFTTDFALCDPGSKIQLHNTNIAYRNGSYDATFWRTSECNIVGMHAHYVVWSNLDKWDQTP